MQEMTPLASFWQRKTDAFIKRLRVQAAIREVERFPHARAKSRPNLPSALTISLTSYAARFPTLHLTLKSLLDQTVQADRTVLWLSSKDYDVLPADVHALEEYGLEIRKTEDIRSYTKLIPALQSFPDDFIVTADDDFYYPRQWLDILLAGYDHENPAVVTRRAHLARVDARGRTLPYEKWGHDVVISTSTEPGTALFPTGVCGVLYPPRTFTDEVFNADAFLSLCPFADDIWFFWMQMLAGRKQLRVGERMKMINWPNSQEHALFKDNLLLARNDEQVKAIEGRYGPLSSFVTLGAGHRAAVA